MKRYLYLSAAAVSIFAASLPAHAQSTYDPTLVKGEDRLMNDTRRIEPEPMPQRTSSATTQERISTIQPAAGDNWDRDDDAGAYADFTGVYGGGDLGYSFTDDLKGMNGSLFLGYGFEHSFDILGAYAGVEIAYEWSGADGSDGPLPYEKDHAWTATFRPGMSVWQDVLGYAIIGYTLAEIEAGGTDDDLDGLVLGLGGQFDTNTPFKPRIEYVHTRYEDASIGGADFDSNENALKLGAVFQF